MIIRIFYEDTDCGGIVYHSNYIKYCERARSEMIFENSSKAPFSKDNQFVVKKLEADFIASATLGDLIEVRSNILKLKNASVEIEHKIYKIGEFNHKISDEKLLFICKVQMVFMKNQKISKMNDEFKTMFLNYDKRNKDEKDI